jgi:hypothetical protein
VVVAAAALLFGLALLAVLAYGAEVRAAVRKARLRAVERPPAYDPGRDRRAERKARELLRSVVGEELYEMYRELGFIRMAGGGDARSGYGYLIYPNRPIVAYEERSGELLNEYCVTFPERIGLSRNQRLPDSDDVLAKWMALSGDERRLISDANMHVPGRQLDPMQVRRDLLRLREWEGRRSRAGTRRRDDLPLRSGEGLMRNDEVSA